MALEIKDLYVEVKGKEIIKGISLVFEPGKVHALMGPNGSGKSTLANAIMGHPKYKITHGWIILDGKDITNEKPDVRAKLGLFLSFQYPAEISGVTIEKFLRTAVNSRREKPYSVMDFHKFLLKKMELLKMDDSFRKRYLNLGFSGGEKKKAEILQLVTLEPNYAFLDEVDSGVDVDALKIIAGNINKIKELSPLGIIIITHYNKFLQYIVPDQVSILYQGKIIARGGVELAHKIEEEGFTEVIKNGN